MVEALMSMSEVASLLSCSTMAVRKWAREGYLPHYRVGSGDPNRRLYKFRQSEILEWLESKRYRAAART